MPDNVTLDNNTTTGETIRTVRKSSIQHPVSILDVGTHPDDNSGGSSLVSKENNVGMPVEGLSDSQTVSNGAPVLIGGKHLSSAPTLTSTHVATLLLDEKNNLSTTIVGKNTENGIAIDGSGAISVAGVATIDYDTLDPVEGDDNTDNTTCVGIVVPAAGGAAAVKSTSIQNTVATVPDDPVVGLNTSHIGSFFFDGHTGANDTTNVAAFGIAIASSAGPKAIGSDGTTTTYLPVSFESNEVKLAAAASASSVIGTVKISATDNTVDISNQAVKLTAADSASSVIGTVKVSATDNTVDISNQAVKLTAADVASSVIGTVKVSATDNTVDISNQAVKLTAADVASSVIGTVKVSATDNTVDISNQAVKLTAADSASSVIGTVKVSATDNTVDISNQAVKLTAADSASSVIGTVKVSATDNTVQVDNFPASQVVDLSNNNDVRIVGSSADGLEVHSSVTYTNGIVTLGGGTNRCLYSISAFNLTGNKLFLKFFSASNPVLGTNAASMTFLIPANANNGAGFVLSVPQGMDTGSNGIQYAITTGVSQSSTTGVNSGDVILNLAFK